MILGTDATSDSADGNQNILQHLRLSRIHSEPIIALGEYHFG
jgi:hypothetical protein